MYEGNYHRGGVGDSVSGALYLCALSQPMPVVCATRRCFRSTSSLQFSFRVGKCTRKKLPPGRQQRISLSSLRPIQEVKYEVDNRGDGGLLADSGRSRMCSYYLNWLVKASSSVLSWSRMVLTCSVMSSKLCWRTLSRSLLTLCRRSSLFCKISSKYWSRSSAL